MSDTFFSQEQEEIYSPPQRLNLLPFIRIIKRKAWLISLITALVAGGYTFWDWKKSAVPQYAGSFQLLVEPLNFEAKLSEPTTLTDSRGVPNDRLLAADYPTLIRILTSKDILSKISEKVANKYPEVDINRLAQNLTVQRIGTSRIDASKILAISYQETDPKLVKLVLETTVEEYLDYSLNSRIKEISNGLQFIEKQLPELNQKVAQNRNEIQKLQEQYQMIQADTKGESLLETVRQIELQQLETQKEIDEQTRIKNNLASQLNITVDEAIAISALRENPNYQSLLQDYKAKERELAVVSATFNSNSPQVIHLEEEKQELLALLNTETRRITSEKGVSVNANKFLVTTDNNSLLLNLVRQLVETGNQLEALQARQQALSKNASGLQQQAQQFPEVSRKYQELQQELNIANRTREQLLIQKDRLQVQASQTQAPWTIISQPQILSDSAGNPVPLPTDSNNTILKGLMAGLFLGVAAAVLIEKSRNRFFTPEDISDATKQSLILGEIPFNPNLSKTHIHQTLVKSWFDSPTHYLSETGQIDQAHFDFLNAFYKLHANIFLRYRDEPIQSLAVCSPKKADGRSTVALYLARQIAATGKNVLLVDANSFNYQFTDKLITTTQTEKNLFVLVASQKLLDNSAQRQKLMKKLQETYDYVIYDTPPLLDSVTAGFLSVETDGILLVAAIDRTDKSLFMKSFEQIETLKLPLLGIVVNHNGTEKSSKNQLPSIETKLLQSQLNSHLLNGEVDYQSKNNHNGAEQATKIIKPSNNNN